VRDYSEYIFKKPAQKQDDRPWWVRLLASIRPTIGIKGKINPKTKQTENNITIGVKGGFDF
jgi:hypothetical protein